jgi:toxin ParE1/3/4
MKLRYTKQALIQIYEILEHIQNVSPKGSMSIKRRLLSAINLIVEFPNIGQLTSRKNIRRIVVSPYPYIVFYSVSESKIIIHGASHTARKQ